MKYITKVYIIIVLACSCNTKQFVQKVRENKKDLQIESNETISHDVTLSEAFTTEEKYNNCFSMDNGYDELTYKDTLITKTEKGNFLKKVSLGNDTYIWSYGRGKIEKVIDTAKCSVIVESQIDWETEKFVSLIQHCGTYCWTNTIIPLSNEDPIFNLSYSAIDFKNMNVVSIVEDYFVITNLNTKKEIKFPIDGLKCTNGYPIFSVKNISLKDYDLQYKIRCSTDSIIGFNTKIDLIDLLDYK